METNNKSHGRQVCWSCVLGLSVSFVGLCSGCGTEVGNGDKDDGGKGKGTQGSAANPPENTAKEAGVVMPEVLNNAALNIDSIKPLLNGCRSPFAQDLVNPFHLELSVVAPAEAPVLDVAMSGTFWTVKSASAILWKIDPIDDRQTTVKDGSDKPVDAGYTCSGYQMAFNVPVSGLTGTYIRHSVDLTSADGKTTLRWFVNPASDSTTTKLHLIRVEIVPAGESNPIIWKVTE